MLAIRNRLAVVLGVWTAVTAGPLAVYTVSGPVDAAVSPVEAGVLAGLFLAGTLAARAVVGRMDDPATRLREGLELAGPMAVSGLTALAAFPLVLADADSTALAFGLGGALGFLTAFLVGYLADREVIARVRAASDDTLTFTARKRPASRVRLALSGVAVVAAVAWLAAVLWDGSLALAVVPAILGLAQLRPLLQGRVRRHYEVTDRGLINWIGHLPWEKFDGFALTDDALVLHGNVWPFGTVAFDRESVDDLDAVVEALERHLPRDIEDSDDPMPLDNLREAFGAR